MSLTRPRKVPTLAVLAGALIVAALAFAQGGVLDDPARPAEERERDAGSKPLQVYAFFGVEPGQTVVDLMPGGGYNTYLLSKIVGPEGRVFAGPDRRGRVAERVQADGLSNVQVFADIAEVPAGSIDVIVTVRNMHDLELRVADSASLYAAYLQALKPGGVMGVVDARMPGEGVDERTHRINERVIIDHLTAAGFELVDSSDLLANPDDDFGKFEGLCERYEIDRMVLKFRRPTG